MFTRTGWYNITVAGAAGGRGLCNPEKGKGVVTSGRLYVEKGVNDSVLVMVGQQGKGPCDVDSTPTVLTGCLQYHICCRMLL